MGLRRIAAKGLQYLTLAQDGGMNEAGAVAKILDFYLRRLHIACQFLPSVGHNGGGAYHIYLGVGLEVGDLLGQPLRQGEIVSVHAGDVLRFGLCQTAVQGVGETAVFLVPQEANLVGITGGIVL